MELQRLYVTLALDASDFQTGMAAVTGVVSAAAIAATAAITAVAIDGVKAARDMEQQMADIAAVMSMTKDEVAPLGALIKDLGLDPNLKVDATQAADAIEMLARNGLTMDEILQGAAKSTVLLANATGADFGKAANIGTDAMAIFGIEAADMIDAVDGITAVTTNSKFSINDYALALAQGGGVAAAVGVEFDDFNATIAGISPLFKSGSDAGTSLKTMLTRLTGSTGPAAEAMAELGLITEDGNNAFYDANGNLKDMAEMAGIMQQAFGPLTEAQRSQAMQTIFGADAMRAAVGLMELGEQGFRELSATMSQTDAMASAATRMDTLSGAMEVFEGIVDTVKLTLGEALLPTIRMFVDWLIVLADMWMPKIELAFGTLNTVIALFFTNMQAGMLPMDAFIASIAQFVPPELVAQLTMVNEAITWLIQQVTAILMPITQAIAQFVSWQDVLIVIGVSIAATLIPIIISLVATIASVAAPILILIGVVALLRNAWEQNWFGIRDITQNVFLQIQSFIEIFRANWDTNWAAAQSIIQKAWSVIQSIINAVLAVIGPAIEKFVTNASASLSKFDTLLPALGKLWEALKPVITVVLQVIGAALVVLLGVAVGVFNGIANAIGPFIDAFINMSAAIIKIITGVADFFMAFFELLAGMFTQNNEMVADAWTKMGEALNTITTGIVELLVAAITGMYETIISLVEGLVEGVIEFFENLASELVGNSIIPDMLDSIVEVFATAWDSVVEGIKAIDWKGLGKSIVDGIKKGVVEKAKSLADAAVAAARRAYDAVKSFLGNPHSPAPALIPLGKSFSEGIAAGIEQGIKIIVTAVKNAADAVASEGVKEFAEKVKVISDAILSVGEAIQVVNDMAIPAAFEQKMQAVNHLVALMVKAVTNAARLFDAETLKLTSVYADTTKKVSDAVVAAIEAMNAVDEMTFPADFSNKFLGLNYLILVMVRAIKNAAAHFDEVTLKLIQTYSETVRKVSDAVADAVDALNAVDSLTFPANFGAKINTLHVHIFIMINTLKAIGEQFNAGVLALAKEIAANVSGVSTAIGQIVKGIEDGIKHLDKLATMNVPGSVGDIITRMLEIITAQAANAYSVGWQIGEAITRGITEAIQATVPAFLEPAVAGGGAVEIMSGGVKTVIVGEGAFQVTITDRMDFEEFKAQMTDVMREWTE